MLVIVPERRKRHSELEDASRDGVEIFNGSPSERRRCIIASGFVVVLATRESGNGSASSSPLIGKLVPPVAGVGINGHR